MTNVDPVVRSIRIATTLNERFGTIVREAAEYQTVAGYRQRTTIAEMLSRLPAS